MRQIDRATNRKPKIILCVRGWGPLFFANVSSSAITTSFQQVRLRLSEAPSELQVIHSEQVALERFGRPCSSTLEGVECQTSSGAKHHLAHISPYSNANVSHA